MARKSDTTDAAAARGPTGWIPLLGEVVVILLVFTAAGAWPVPDVNETAYLTKARHGVDPAWCRGDFFLETPDAHGVFYRLIGPLAATVSLERTAWVGRWLGWMALAGGFRHATVPLLAGAWSRVLAAAVFSLALRHTTAAGEWVIGGCEAKVFAWALVLAALGEIARSRFARAWLALGAATALHPIVGGWGLVALLMSWCPLRPKLLELLPTPSPPSPGFARHRFGYHLSAFGAGVLVMAGLVLAAAGIVPALGLSAGADAVTRAAAAKIHVVERLSHHLLPRTFADGMVARHVLAILLWWCLRSVRTTAAPQGLAARGRVDRFIIASLAISLAGVAISLLEPVAANAVYGLLRFYWFRLADVLVPFGLATTVAAVLSDAATIGGLFSARPAVIRGLAAVLLVLDLAHESRHWPLPGRAGLVARSDTKVDAAAWREICGWVAANTPADSCFLTPRGAASFTWWTGRREVVGWKNSPQDARSLVEWRRRFVDCFSRDGGFANMERSTAALGADRVRLAAERYGATHAIVPVDVPGAESLPFERLHANRGYAVYRLPPIAATAAEAQVRERP
jgi:hypothetical protein